jgi:hypothetical protein
VTAFSDTFPKGVAGYTAVSPTGEPYVVLQDGGYASQNAAEAAARVMFDDYASNHHGTLYWRCPPETTAWKMMKSAQPTYSFYMRLLISDKETKHG